MEKKFTQINGDIMSLVEKEAQVCNYLNKYLEQEVKKLAQECDTNWLIHDQEFFNICRQNDNGAYPCIVYPSIEIKSILFCEKDVYYVPKLVDQSNVTKYVKEINKECKRILKRYIEYENTVDNNIKMLEMLLNGD